MHPLAIWLILASAVFHAGWNLLSRVERCEHTFLLRVLICVAVIGALPAAVAGCLLPPFPARVWLCLLGSGVACGLYYLGLARAYSSGDFTAVYPVVRAVPVVIVGLGDVLCGRVLTALGWTGMVLVAGACAVIPLHSLRDIHPRLYLSRAMRWALAAAMGTVGYTLTDKAAAEALPRGFLSALAYDYVFFVASGLGYCLCLRLFGRPEEDARRVGWKRPALAALLNFGGYGLVLWAMQLAASAGYVLAFRQVSIVIGVVVAFRVFRERGVVIRLAAACVIFLGLALIAVYG